VGIEAAQGRYVAFLDCDDRWRPEKLERQISAMRASGAVLSWASYQVRDADWNPTRVVQGAPTVSFRDFVRKRAILGCLTVIYDREAFPGVRFGGMRVHEDFCLWADMLSIIEAENWKAIGLSDILADYQSVGGMSENKKKAATMQWRAYREHLGFGVLKSALCFGDYAVRGVASRLLGQTPRAGRPDSNSTGPGRPA